MLKPFTLALTASLFCLPIPAFSQSQSLSLTERLEQTAEGSFERGAYETLSAVETLLQTRYEFGIGRSFGFLMGTGSRDQVALRNPSPKPRRPNTFANMITTFQNDLVAARETLAQNDTTTAQPFEMTLNDIWFDINQDGTRQEHEDLSTLVLNVALTSRQRRELEQSDLPVTIRFDGADHAWLMAYSNMLSGLTEVVMAFDPSPIFDDLVAARARLAQAPTIPYTFDVPALLAEIEALEEEIKELAVKIEDKREREKEIGNQLSEIRNQRRKTTDKEERAALDQQRAELRNVQDDPTNNTRLERRAQRSLNREIDALKMKLPASELSDEDRRIFERRQLADSLAEFQEPIDAFYAMTMALRQQPDTARIAKVEEHLRTMLAQNRMFWDALALETDNDREWIPNPNQTSALGIEVTAELASTWQNILSDGEALLDGRLLIPHPLLPQGFGISLSDWLAAPSSIDLIAWAHGRSAYDYAAKGPLISEQNWLAFSRLTSGRAGSFALFFN